MPDPMTTTPRMTAVFEYDLKQHPGNPFHTDTPFGRPLVLELGDFSEADCEAVAEDRGTDSPKPRADLCADPALLAEAGKVLDEIVRVDPFENPLAASEAEQKAADLITAILARIAAQEAQIKGLEAENRDMVSLSLMLTEANNLIEELEAAIDSQDAQEAGLWRFWSRKATELADKLRPAETALADMTKERDEHHQNWERAFNANVRWLEKCEAQQEALDAERAKVAKLVEALNTIDALDPEGRIGDCSVNAISGLVLRMGEIARAAITEASQ